MCTDLGSPEVKTHIVSLIVLIFVYLHCFAVL